MSCNNDLLAIQPRKQYCLLDYSSFRRVGASSRTRHPRICSSTSLTLTYGSSSQADLNNILDPLDDIALDSNLGELGASSTTLFSPSLTSTRLLSDANCTSSEFDLPSGLSESRQLYPLREPGELTTQRRQRLRARTAAVIMTLPATSEDEHRQVVEAPPQGPKLRRVSGYRDLRRAFREGDHGSAHFVTISSLGGSKAADELGFIASPTSPLSPLSPRSSLRTLVDMGKPQSFGDLKTLCGSTLSSISIASRFATKLHSTLPASRPSHTRSPSDTLQSISSQKYLVHNPSTPRPRRHASLQLDTLPSRPPGEAVWSCAKISQSSIKRAARRRHPPRRVFSNPITVPSS